MQNVQEYLLESCEKHSDNSNSPERSSAQMRRSREVSGRIKWIDFTKGLAIVLVIIGHTISCKELKYIIYSFHVPLFFAVSILACRFSSCGKDIIHNAKKSFRRLIMPAIGLWALHDVLLYIADRSEIENSLAWGSKRLLSILFSSGRPFQLCGISIPSVGILWFLVALFVGKTIFDIIHCYASSEFVVAFFCTLLCVSGVLIGQRFTLPFSLDYALTIQPFLWFGLCLRRWRESSFCIGRLVLGLFGWGATAICIWYACSERMLEIALKSYPLFPICFCMACFAVIAVCEFSKLIVSIEERIVSTITALFVAFGRESIWLFGVHHMDGMWKKYIISLTAICSRRRLDY